MTDLSRVCELLLEVVTAPVHSFKHIVLFGEEVGDIFFALDLFNPI